MVSVFCLETVRPAAPKTVTMTVIIFARPSADIDPMSASSAYSIPHTAFRTDDSESTFFPVLPEVLIEVNQVSKTI